MKLQNRIAIITGATGALGTVVTQTFLQNGAKVMATYHDEKSFHALERTVGSNGLRGMAVDVTSPQSVQALIDHTLSQFGQIDILVNLVGGFLGGINVVDLAEAEWDRMINLNLKSAFLVGKAVLPHMMQRSHGRIVNISSKGALDVLPGSSAYSVAKAGVITLTTAIARESKSHGITANVILPGTIDTAANRAAMPDADFSKWVKPQAIADMILFLCSDQARDITGAAIPVYGQG